MKISFLIRSAFLFLIIATLAGCIVGVRDDGYRRGEYYDRDYGGRPGEYHPRH